MYDRFETLQLSTAIHQQPLISPLCVETTAAEEMIIAQNIGIFENNGFHVQVGFF